MKKKTIDVLRNFASINQGILVSEGNELKTMSVMKNVFAKAKVPDEFDREFAIYDLNEFISTLSLLDSPELEYKKEYLAIRSGRTNIRYHYSSPAIIVSPPRDKEIKVVSQMSFKLTGKELEALLKAAAVMKLQQMEISDNQIKVFNSDSSGNLYTVDIETKKDDVVGKKVINVDNVKLLPGDYDVEVSERVVKFTSADGDVEYIIACEA